MTISKRITTKKTPYGYCLIVWVKNPEIHKDLTIGVKKFFEKIESEENNKNGMYNEY